MPTRATWFLLAAAATVGCGDEDTGGGDESIEVLPGNISVDPTAIDVGELALHESASVDLTISNAGEGPLIVYDVQMADDSQRAHWTLQGGISGELAPGESTSLVVIASPGDIVDLGTRLEVLSDDPDSPTVFVTLAGSSHGEAEARISPASLDVGSVAVGTSVEGEITIANDGSASLAINAVALSYADTGWSIELSPSGTEVAPQSEDGLIVVAFAPTEIGLSTNSLLINTGDPDAATVEVTLIGAGI